LNLSSIFSNPLLIKQLREEVRSRKIFFIVPVYIALLSIVPLIAVSSSSGTSFNPVELANTSRITMYSFIITISILLGLVSIVFGAASFTVEREKATYELLELTPLSYVDLVIGKFLHGFILIILILLSSLPVLSTLFFMGGLAYSDLFLTLIYLTIFFSVILLGTICISIVSSRTILSIILSLALGFVVAVLAGILTTAVTRQPRWLGFAVFSPWLVTWRQIFDPTPLKLSGYEVPVWPLYLGLYSLIGLLFVCWGRNALDSRKLERNPWVRLITLLLFNSYLLIGMLCWRSYGPINKNAISDFFDALMIFLMFTLPCFAMGTLTDRDQSRFVKRPLLESLNLRRVLMNDPLTGMLFLMLSVLTVGLNVAIISGAGIKIVSEFAFIPFVWIMPWFLMFIALRLWGFRPRGLFIAYVLGTILYAIISAFDTSPPPSGFTEFLVGNTRIVFPWLIAVPSFIIARIWSSRRAKASEGVV
jgi:ABC-type transport system involved in multi-copper enzyme maturation permease subunit